MPRSPFADAAPRYRLEDARGCALEQAVILHNGRAHAVGASNEQVVATATAFEAFLTRPEEATTEAG